MRAISRALFAVLVLLPAIASGVRAQPAPPAATGVSCATLGRPDRGPERVCIREAEFFGDVCKAIERYADGWRLPAAVFARLIWQESHFDPNALSRAGAQGIAQFMPSTARLRGLHDPFDPAQALASSAEYLRFLEEKYGNLGLASAAYNSGEARVSWFTSAGGYLPLETREYVEIVTGRPVEHWLLDDPEPVDFTLGKDMDFHESCVQLARSEALPRLQPSPGDWMAWGVMLAQDFSRAVALRQFERAQSLHPSLLAGEKPMLLSGRNPNFGPRLRHFAMVGRNTREEAESLCAALRAAGGSCIVRKN